MRKLLLAGVFLIGGLVGCTQAHIALPSQVASNTQRLELTGVGAWPSGRFNLGSSQGHFTRRSAQTSVNRSIRNFGGGSFEVTGPELGGSVSGRCGFDEREFDAGIFTVPTGRLSYHCTFLRDGQQLTGGLLLAEVPNGTGLLATRTRAGQLQIGDLSVGIQPIHHAAGGGLPTGMPLGYTFDVAGRQIGAVDLAGGTKNVYAPTQPGVERDAVLIASLALSVFWDPGE